VWCIFVCVISFFVFNFPNNCIDFLFFLQDFDDEDAVTVAFTLNGEMQGIAYKIAHSELQDKALFPHILSKNTKFKCNFGNEDPWFPPPDGYTYVAHVPLDERVSGAKRPEKREDCEVQFSCSLR
jgi:heterogeneous nuclear ribonucleoprotein U-like protein 1